jgi:prevent-host-death family protein
MAIQIQDIHPLTEFQRNAKAHLLRVNKTGRPEVLTVNGKPEAVLLGKRAYAKMMEAMEELEALKSIRLGLSDMEEGKTVSATEVHQKLRGL